MHAHPHPRPQAKNQKFHRLLLLLFPLFFASCEDSEIFILLNPDGSGRITTTERRLTSEIPGLQDRAVLQEVSIRTLAEIVIGTSGIDEWESVAYTITDTGDIKLELTGLFSNINDLQLETTGATSTLINGLKFDQGDATRPASVQLLSPIARLPAQAKPEGPLPDDDVIAKELKRTRTTWEEAEANIRPSFGKKSSKVTLHLAGDIVSQSNFKKDAKNQVTLQITAPQMIDTLEKVIESDELALKILKTGAKIMANEGAPPIDHLTFNQLSFGEAKPIQVEFTPGTAHFDYQTAVEAAKANPSPMLNEVKILVAEAKAKAGQK